MMFGNFENPDKRIYDEITDFETLQVMTPSSPHLISPHHLISSPHLVSSDDDGGVPRRVQQHQQDADAARPLQLLHPGETNTQYHTIRSH
jgi:hypothetical protein